MIGGNLWNKKYVSKATGKDIDDIAGGGGGIAPLAVRVGVDLKPDVSLQEQINALIEGRVVYWIIPQFLTSQYGFENKEFYLFPQFVRADTLEPNSLSSLEAYAWFSDINYPLFHVLLKAEIYTSIDNEDFFDFHSYTFQEVTS